MTAPPRSLAMSTPRIGLGFRTAYAEAIANTPESLDWLEVVSDHYLGAGGPRRALLERLRCEHPIALHGVGLGVAGSDPLDAGYLDALCELVARCEPVYVSDHLCWTALGGQQSHDLLPVAYTGEVLRHVAERVARVQDQIGRTLLLENATAYVHFRADEITEAEFFAELCRATGCGILLDVNNLYVTAMNLGAAPEPALALLPESAVGYLHLAGHAVLPDVRIDTHAASVPEPVWRLFEAAVQRFPRADVILERDDDLPPYEALVAELELARARRAAALSGPRERGPAPEVPARGSQRGGADWDALQRAFWQRVVECANGAGLGELLDERLPVSAARGMRVYSDGYRASLRDALATNFPSLAHVIGARDWAQLCAAYLAEHPPRGYGFVGLGAALAAFVRDYRFAADHGVPQCVFAEMAELEQAQLEAQDAPEPERSVTPSQLAAVDPADWEHAHLVFAPSVRVVRATHDVAPVVLAASRGETPERSRAGEHVYLVARRGDGVETIPLRPGDGALALALLAGRTFGAACATAGEASGADRDEAAEQGARWLVNACAQGWVAAVEVGGFDR